MPANCVASNKQKEKNMNNEVSPVNNTIIEAPQNNQVIAYPTEAVFGVGCDPDSESAVMALLELNREPLRKGLF